MKNKVMVDIVITCDPPRTYVNYSMEELAKYYERWASEFHDFIRDHRSQDPVSLNIERIYEDQCSFCGGRWDADEETGEPFCCQDAIDAFNSGRAQ